MVSLPGSYPLDDSAPATPDESMTQQPHHTHNKLYKRNDPRVHQQTDSGIGIGPSGQTAVPQTTVPSLTEESHHRSDFLDVTGGDNYTFEPTQRGNVDSEVIRTTDPKNIPHDASRETNVRDTRSSELPRDGMMAEKAGSDKSENNSLRQNDNSEAPPYWGNLPKGQRGGIYNTVTGHGSPKDDHDQHHHIPERSARPERAHMTGTLVADQLRGGVYNTVAGHGSQDEESKRHNQPTQPSSGGATIASTDAVLDAPLAGIPEHKSFRDLGMGFLPETAARDDAKLLSRSQGTPQVPPSAISSTTGAESKPKHPTTSQTSPKSDTMHQRAFPLAPSNMLNEEDSKISHSDDHRNAMYGGAAGLGTGIAVSEWSDRQEPKASLPVAHEEQHRRSSSSPESRHGRNRLSKSDKHNRAAAAGVTDHHHNGKDKSSEETNKTRDDSPPKGEKKHRLFGIFSRHKDDEDSEDTSTTDPAKEDSPRHSGYRKEEVAAGAAVGADAMGLMNRHKDEKKPKDQSPPLESTKRDDQHQAKTTSRKESPPSTSGRVGYLHRHEDTPTSNYKEMKIPEVTRQQPEPSHAAGLTQRQASPTHPAAAFSETTQGQQGGDRAVPNFSQPIAPENSRTGANMIAAGLGAGVGVGAYQAAHKRDNISQPQPSVVGTSPTSAGADAFENPRESPTHPVAEPHGASYSTVPAPTSMPIRTKPVVTNEPGHYNTLSSGTASGVATDTKPTRLSRDVKHDDSKHHIVLPTGATSGIKTRPVDKSRATNPGDYNTLSSGTTSGVGTGPSAHRAVGKGDDSSPTYNVLASGTPSGVKVDPHKHRKSQDLGRKSGEYKTPSSGTASGINTDNQVSVPLAGVSVGDDKPQKHASPGYVSVPLTTMPLRSGHVERKPQQEEQTADRLRHMSPEVLPASYTASAPRQGTAQASQDVYTTDDIADRVRHMSPEVMPSAYTSSAPRSGDIQESGVYNPPASGQSQAAAQPRSSNIDPALAAATGAWAASDSGVTGGTGWPTQHRGPGGKTVLFNCDHCGKENDITSYVSK